MTLLACATPACVLADTCAYPDRCPLKRGDRTMSDRNPTHCPCCQGGRNIPCRDPRCGDSTWDHECTADYVRCAGIPSEPRDAEIARLSAEVERLTRAKNSALERIEVAERARVEDWHARRKAEAERDEAHVLLKEAAAARGT